MHDTAVSVDSGEVVAVVGDVGSGKTALCKSLIGELVMLLESRTCIRPASPLVDLRGSIPHCAQDVWLIKGTINDKRLGRLWPRLRRGQIPHWRRDTRTQQSTYFIAWESQI